LNSESAAGQLEFESTEFRVSENGTPIAAVAVVRANGSFGEVTAKISLTGESATFGEDYSQDELTVTFSSGQTYQTIDVPLLDDKLFEGNETIALTLSNPTGGVTLGQQTTAILTVVENDRPGTIAFSSSQFSGNEDGVATVTINRTGGSDGEVSIFLDATDGSATSSGDYNISPTTLTFADGETSKTVEIPLVNDSLFEDTETINLNLSSPTNGATLGARSSAVLNILDDDAQPGTLSFSQANYTINENGTSDLAVTLLRTEGSDGPVSVTVALSDDTATGGDDYVARPITVNFANGETSKPVTLPIINDTVLEAAETLNLTLTNATGGAILGAQSTAVLTLEDDEFRPQLTLALAETAIAEDGGTVTGTVTRNTPPQNR
jgi:hypothetical protein